MSSSLLQKTQELLNQLLPYRGTTPLPSTPLEPPSPLTPTLLILTTKSYGKGHHSAAMALEEGIRAEYGEKYHVVTLDLIRECNKYIDHALALAYNNSVRYTPTLWKWFFYHSSGESHTQLLNFLGHPFFSEKLAEIITTHRPAIVISTYPPLWNYSLQKILKSQEHRPKLVNVITDSLVIHRSWVNTDTDHYIVANTDTKHIFHDLGVPSEKVHALGFPVGLAFEDPSLRAPTRATLGLTTQFTVLFMAGTGATKKEFDLVLRLSEHFGDRITLLVITGKNRSMLTRLQDSSLPPSVHLFGWTNKVASYMHASDLVITKAGGATIMECIAAQRPVIITKVIPGQEEGNASTIERYGLGHVETEAEGIIARIEEYLETPEHRTALQEGFSHLCRAHAARSIARFLVEEVLTPPTKGL